MTISDRFIQSLLTEFHEMECAAAHLMLEKIQSRINKLGPGAVTASCSLLLKTTDELDLPLESAKARIEAARLYLRIDHPHVAKKVLLEALAIIQNIPRPNSYTQHYTAVIYFFLGYLYWVVPEKSARDAIVNWQHGLDLFASFRPYRMYFHADGTWYRSQLEKLHTVLSDTLDQDIDHALWAFLYPGRSRPKRPKWPTRADQNRWAPLNPNGIMHIPVVTSSVAGDPYGGSDPNLETDPLVISPDNDEFLIEDVPHRLTNLRSLRISDPINLDPRRKYFITKVNGESMIQAGIFDGDYVLLVSQNTAALNRIVQIYREDDNIDEKHLLKRFKAANGEKKFVSDNPDKERYPDLDAKYFTIYGVALGVFKSFDPAS